MIKKLLLSSLIALPLTGFTFTSTNYTAHYAVTTAKASGIQERKFSCQRATCEIETNMVVKVLFKKVTINTLDKGVLNAHGNFVSSALVITDSRADTSNTVILSDGEYSLSAFSYELSKALADNEDLQVMAVYFNGQVQTFTPTVISTDEIFSTDNGDITTTHIQVATSGGATIDFYYDRTRQNLMVGNTVTNADNKRELSTHLTSVEFL